MEKLPYRVRKTLNLHQGASSSVIFKALEPFGFTKEVQEEGRARLRAVGVLRKKEVVRTNSDPGLNVRIEEFQSLWFPIVRATLNASFPELSSNFFEGLVQRKGMEAPMSLTTFVARVRELESDIALFGEDGTKARELLAKRGLTGAVMDIADELLEGWGETIEDDVVAAAPTDELKQAMESAWDWYVEWSTIARAVLKRPRVLRQLGLNRRRDGRGRDAGGNSGSVEASPANANQAAPQLEAQKGPAAAE